MLAALLTLCAAIWSGPALAQQEDSESPLITVSHSASVGSEPLARTLAEGVIGWLRSDGRAEGMLTDGLEDAEEAGSDWHLAFRVSGWSLGESNAFSPRISRDHLLSTRPDVARISVQWELYDGAGELSAGDRFTAEESDSGEAGRFDHPVELSRAEFGDPTFRESRMGHAAYQAAAELMLKLYDHLPPPRVRIAALLPDGRAVLEGAGRQMHVRDYDEVVVRRKHPVEIAGDRVPVEFGRIARLSVREVREDYALAVIKERNREFFSDDELLVGRNAELVERPLLRRYREMR